MDLLSADKVAAEDLQAWLAAYPQLLAIFKNPCAADPKEFLDVPAVIVLETLGTALAIVAKKRVDIFGGLDLERIDRLVALIRNSETRRSEEESKAYEEIAEQGIAFYDWNTKMDEELVLYEQVKVSENLGIGTRPIKYLLQKTTIRSVQQLLDIMLRSADVLDGINQKNMPDLDFLRTPGGRHWLTLSDATHINIKEDVRDTLILWKIAKPAIEHPSRPGITSALTYGLQLPLRVSQPIPLSESGIMKSLNNLRASWSEVLAEDPGIVQWVTWSHAGQLGVTPEVLGKAIRSFASADVQWKAPRGRKSRDPKPMFSVGAWVCDSCGRKYLPGDHSHDSPSAKRRTEKEEVKSISAKPTWQSPKSEKGEYNTHHRVLYGLPDEAHTWYRLMCASPQVDTSQQCWERGGVLVPVK